jgi:hypothetical protein
MSVILIRAVFLLSFLPLSCSTSLKIDNALVGPPKLECLSDSIVVSIVTKGPFFGRVFVKGQSHLPGCSIRGGSGALDSNKKSLHILFEDCFLRRARVFSPQRGIIVTTTIVISFHPFFLTESDSAYRVQCRYLNGQQSLSALLNVYGDKTTTQSNTSQLPTCKYEVFNLNTIFKYLKLFKILDGGPNGRPVPLASVGTHVYHKWHCQGPPNRYCTLIHSCKL